MIVRDVHNRCTICGATVTEPCCPDCPHPTEVNTEAVNQ